MTAVPSLTALGFTETEALVYCELLKRSPATGYRLAQAIGKAPANTYQALSSLAQRGAVMVDDADARSFRPVPPGELVAGLAQAFSDRAAAAEAALAKLHSPRPDDRIYQLGAAAQVMEKARAMIEGAREILLFDLFPRPYAALLPALETAARQGVTVAGLAYEDHAAATGVIAVRSENAAFTLDRWPGDQISLVADAGQFLVALLDGGDEALHGVWSDSPYLACLQHSGLASEIRLAATPEPALSKLSLLSTRPAGLRRLVGPGDGVVDTPSKPGDAA